MHHGEGRVRKFYNARGNLVMASLTLWSIVSALIPAASGAETAGHLRPVVEVEEVVYRYDPADNGAGPMWCSGSTCLVRVGDLVFASGLETLVESKPLNNCRWMLFLRTDSGWELLHADPQGRTREPCPLAVFQDGRVFLSANPTLTPPDHYHGPARPEILEWDSRRPSDPLRTLLPEWDGQPAFTEHSYRSFAADGDRGELILFQNVGYAHAEWTFRDADQQWAARGKLTFPWGADYEKPQPIRLCYPTIQLRGRAVYFCGISDIIEPNLRWREYKKERTGRDWDYDFRRLFFTWTDDITKAPFRDWIEIASREETCGWIFPCDLWAEPDGTVHLLWAERALDPRLRATFFPDARQSHALNYATVREGKVLLRRALVLAEEGGANLIAGAGRFHQTSDGRLCVIYYVSGTDGKARSVSENRLVEIYADGAVSEPVSIGLERPFTSFFTATARAGSAPSDLVDLLGTRSGEPNTIRYARIRLASEPSLPKN
jgi:hypothetical protein